MRGSTRRGLPLVVGALVIVALLALARTLGHPPPSLPRNGETFIEEGPGYVTIIDAGSSGCRAHVFKYTRVGVSVSLDPRHESLKVRPGLSTFVDDPAAAGRSLDPLLDFMRGQIPEPMWMSSPVYLKATAGLRMLPLDRSEAILESVRGTLAASEFMFDVDDGAKIIAGTDEGGFGWLSVNYLMHNFENEHWTAVVEMGGASAQVTELARSNLRGRIPDGSSFSFAVGGKKYDLYANSYLGYGLEQAREKINAVLRDENRNEDPCLYEGYAKSASDERDSVYDGAPGIQVAGAGDFGNCRALVETVLFPQTPCSHASCSRIQGAFQPKDLPEANVLAFENFYYTASMLGLHQPDTQPQQFRFEAKKVCNTHWTDLLASDYPKDDSDKADLTKLCFSGVYLAMFLEKGLGLQPDKKITVQQTVDGNGIDWSLGAAIHETSKLAAAAAAARA
ncbi:hypothetical protein CTAYLR_002961 [Chrysophaeum taylorii]|uniref:Apyrase n=1 Tax=Chrysophaeum taylorii TaxID=2483200 RepID=A0AAD7U4W0_9STRA|nr:hypothetical protein CTAYLR_002961 [Chrysophaeum taylorii]